MLETGFYSYKQVPNNKTIEVSAPAEQFRRPPKGLVFSAFLRVLKGYSDVLRT